MHLVVLNLTAETLGDSPAGPYLPSYHRAASGVGVQVIEDALAPLVSPAVDLSANRKGMLDAWATDALVLAGIGA